MSSTLDIAHLLHEKQTALVFTSFFYGAILLDFIMCLPAEIKYIYFRDFKALFTRGKIPPVPSLLLFIGRAVTLPLLITAFTAFLGRTPSCSVLWRAVLMLYAICAMNAQGIFVVRVVAIRNSSLKMTIFLFILIICHGVAVIYWLLQAKAIDNPLADSPFQPSCSGIALPRWTWKLVIGFGCLDLILLFLTINESNDFKTMVLRYKLMWKTLKSQETTVTQRFYCDSILLFTVQISVIFTHVGWLYVYAGNNLRSLLVAPVHVFLSVTLAPKTIRALKLFHAKHGSNNRSPRHMSSNQRFDDVAGRYNNIWINRTVEKIVQGPTGSLTRSGSATDDTQYYFEQNESAPTFEIVSNEKVVAPVTKAKAIKSLPPLLPSTFTPHDLEGHLYQASGSHEEGSHEEERKRSNDEQGQISDADKDLEK